MKRQIVVHHMVATLTLILCGSAHAQTDNQAAHNQGMSLGQGELNRVGTSNINEHNAQELVPFSKDQPIQKNDSRTDANLFFDMGVGQINSSRNYSAGTCDREGFNPEAEARKGLGESKWNQMTEAQKQEAIKNQQSFFDQECEGINFLAGEYPGRTEHVIQPGDDLAKWEPDTMPPDVPGECRTETTSTPSTYDKYYCNESTAIESRQCHETANVTVSYSDGLPQEPYVETIFNSNSPRWELTVYPADGLISVYAANAVIGSERVCRYECWEGGGDAGAEICSNVCREENVYGPATEVISMYGGQTTIWQTHFIGERFRVRSRPDNSCVFRIDNWHYEGGAGSGPEDNHMTWTHNFCVPMKNVNVTWSNNCGQLETAANR